MKARLLFRHKHVYADGAIVEMKVWSVPKSSKTPEGYKYSLAYIEPKGRRTLGYDNAEGKGHHRHEGKKEKAISFESIKELTKKFLAEVQTIRRKAHES